MIEKFKLKDISLLALGLGIIVGGYLTSIWLPKIYTPANQLDLTAYSSDHDEDDKFHLHTDFLIVINNNEVDLSDDKYMSTSKKILSPNVHLHDNDGKVIHFHAPNITIVEFLNSIGFSLTKECLETDQGNKYCNDEGNVLKLYVNETKLSNNQIESYIPSDDDRILLYYGNAENPELDNYLKNVTEDSCLYSGTCPERGIAPPESCGLTCEI